MGDSITPERWQLLEPLLDKALELPPGERPAFLDRACAHLATRRELERMLAECDRGPRVLHHPLSTASRLAALSDTARERPLPELIGGRYRIESLIGEGGMATVYAARDTHYKNRRVALKVLTAELAHAVRRERFLREIETAATLTHPNIVPLYDSGESDGFLFYAMPVIRGQSLRHRLQRERQLPIPEAIRIATDIAGALAYAHDSRIVHRDIKPENVLFDGQHVFVCDFGIAHAVAEADPRLTGTGVVIGTPQYMSPEQATGDPELDHRSDIYSLACVLYEMIAGRPPFSAPSRQETITLHVAAEVPSLRALRPVVPESLQRAIEVALAKVPSARYVSAPAFAAAIALERHGPIRPEGTRIVRQLLRSNRFMAAAGVGLVVLATTSDEPRRPTSGPNIVTQSGAPEALLDSSRYVLLSAPGSDTATSRLAADALRLALHRWDGVTVAAAADAAVATDHGHHMRDTADDLAIGAALGAGRVVRIATTRSGDSIDVEAVARSTTTGRVLADPTVRVASRREALQSVIAGFADSVLFAGVRVSERATGPIGTRFRAARLAYLKGQLELDAGDLLAAASQFDSAATFDQEYAQALVWLALVRSWIGEPSIRWSYAAERAVRSRATLGPRDAMRARALQSLGSGDVPRAARSWRQLVSIDSSDFTSWLSFAECLRADSTVMRDPTSPSGFRFRVNYNDVLDAYERALRFHPALERAFRDGSFARLRAVFMTAGNALRAGRLQSDTLHFLAYPYLQGDSIVFVPYPESLFASVRSVTRTPRVDDAVRHQRRRFHQLATLFRTTAADSASALEAVAVSLDLLGNASAFDTLRRARRISPNATDQFRMAGLEIWMRVKYALPDDQSGLSAALLLADSLLADHQARDAREAKLLASLAALRGRAGLAAQYSLLAESRAVSPSIANTAPRLLAFAAIGGPPDSIGLLMPLVDREIERSLLGSERDDARDRWLLRAALLAVPTPAAHRVRSPPNTNGRSARLYAAWSSGERNTAEKMLSELEQLRHRSVATPDITVDAIYEEAAILSSLGNGRRALAWMRPTLDSISFVETQTLMDAARAGPLARLVALRSVLESSVGDRGASRLWARALLQLWNHADDFLDPTVRQMRVLAR